MNDSFSANSARCAVLIPAYNEEAHVASVIEVAHLAALGEVWVIDDGSQDATAEVARQAGAKVLRLSKNLGKGGAVVAGAKHLTVPVLLLIDADLTGLRPEHLQQLVAPVLAGNAEMTRGDFVGGRWRTSTAQKLTPQLNGQRAIVRERLLEITGLAKSRYGLEVAITDFAKRAGWRVVNVPLEGVSQVMKEEKRGVWQGVTIRLKMYAEIVLELLRGWLRARF